MKLLPALAVLVLFGPVAGVADIAWQPTFDEALAMAAAENRVTFVAVNMDGERANDRMADTVYKDKRVRQLAESTVNMVASNFDHSKAGLTCKRFGAITCDQHRQVDVDVRGKVLAPDEQGYVIAPQHVWLAPSGDVLLSVPYSITIEEMEWCFVTALQMIDPDFEWKLSEGARAPKRLVLKGVAQTGEVDGIPNVPPTREEALEIIEKLKRGARGAEARTMLKRLALADEPEARDYLVGYLRTSARGGGGGGGRGGGGGANQEGPDRRVQMLRWIGDNSPVSYWEVCAEFISAGEDPLRAEVVVALEQLAAPDSLKLLLSAVKKEKDPRIKKNLLRAIGAAGGAESKARKALIKQAEDKRNELWKINSIVALGFLAADEDVKSYLTELITEGAGRPREAALLAVAFTRDTQWLEFLEAFAEEQATKDDERLHEVVGLVIAALKGAQLSTLQATLNEVAEDQIPRTRLFGRTSEAGRSRE